VLVGSQVTYTATLSPDAVGGTVDFTADGVTIAGCGAAAVDPVFDTASCEATYSAAGSQSIGASYSGDTDYAGSEAGTFTENVNALPVITTTTTTTTPSTTTTTPTTTTPITTAQLTPAPPSSGVSRATVGRPSNGMVADGSALTVTSVPSASLRGSVSVPAGALPGGTVLSIYPITDRKPLESDLPTGQSYVQAFDVSWRTPGGAAPASLGRIRATITSPSFSVGETIYQLRSSRLTQVGVVTKSGTATITFNQDPAFLIASLTAARVTLADHQPAKIVAYDAKAKPGSKVTAELISAGRVIRKATIKVATTHQLRWNTPALSTGTYKVELLIAKKLYKTTTFTVKAAVVVKKKSP
jgi:hypothetical protein